MPKLFQFLHKWLGFLMAPLMVMWFLTGFVMTYHRSFPRAERASVLKTLDDLSPSDTLPHPAEALALYRSATNPDATIVSVGVEKRKGETLFFLSGSDGDLLLRSSDGNPYPDTPPSVADLKDLSHKITGHTLSEIDTITHPDQWVPFAGRREDLPFYRAKISDEAGTEIYFSGRDGFRTSEDRRTSPPYVLYRSDTALALLPSYSRAYRSVDQTLRSPRHCGVCHDTFRYDYRGLQEPAGEKERYREVDSVP